MNALEFGQGDNSRLLSYLSETGLSPIKQEGLRQLVLGGYSLFVYDKPPTPDHSNLDVAMNLPRGETLASLALIELAHLTGKFFVVSPRERTRPYNEVPTNV